MKCLIQHKELTSAGLEMVIKLTFSLAEESIKASIPELLESASLVYEDEINKQITNLIPIDKAAVESQFMHTAKYSNCVILPKMKSEIEVISKTDYESNQTQIVVAVEYRKTFKTIYDFHIIFEDIFNQIRIELNKPFFEIAYYNFEEELEVIPGPTIKRIAVIKLYRK